MVAHGGGGDADEARVRLCESGRRWQRGRGAGKNKPGGQSKAQDFCIHPKCVRFFHATCHAIMHRRIESSPLLLAGKKKHTGK